MRLDRKRTMFIQTNQPLITSFYIKKYFAELAMSQRLSALFCATGAWGGKPIGHVMVKAWHELFCWTFLTTFNIILYYNQVNPDHFKIWNRLIRTIFSRQGNGLREKWNRKNEFSIQRNSFLRIHFAAYGLHRDRPPAWALQIFI